MHCGGLQARSALYPALLVLGSLLVLLPCFVLLAARLLQPCPAHRQDSPVSSGNSQNSQHNHPSSQALGCNKTLR